MSNTGRLPELPPPSWRGHWSAGEMHDYATAAVAELSRWKSTHAPRLEALQGLLETARLEAARGAEARATLTSERAANARLTDELAEAQQQRDILQAALLEAMRVVAKVDPRGAAKWLLEQGLRA